MCKLEPTQRQFVKSLPKIVLAKRKKYKRIALRLKSFRSQTHYSKYKINQ